MKSMVSALLRAVYDSHARKGSLVRRAQLRVKRSQWMAERIFGVRVRREDADAFGASHPYFDLTTVLLFWLLAPRLKKNPAMRAMEVGSGGYSVLSGSLSRFVDSPIIATELDEERVASAKRHIELNGYNVEVVQANVFPNEALAFDVIFWNLPYYREPKSYLHPLFGRAAEFLSPDGELVVGYNSKPLPTDRVLEILAEFPSLRLERVVSWRWNLHKAAIIRPARGASGPGRSQGPAEAR